jgi:large subunit ribosomal protein L23
MHKKDLHDVIIHPLVTEKMTLLSEKGIYGFKVVRGAGKRAIAKSVEIVFGTKVQSVNLLNQNGKVKYFKGRKGKQKSFKKAFVRLKPGLAIDILEGGN